MFGTNQRAASDETPADVPQEARGAALLLELHPLLSRLRDAHGQMLKRQEEAITEARELAARLLKSGNRGVVVDAGTEALKKTLPPPPSDHPPAVKKLLGELAPPFSPKGSVHEHPDVARFRQLCAELNEIAVALPVLSGELEKAHREASRLVCDHIRAEYQEKVAGRLLAALTEFGNAMIEHGEFRHEFRNVNLVSLKPLPAAEFFGDTDDRASGLRRFLVLAAECGHHDLRNTPEHWGKK